MLKHDVQDENKHEHYKSDEDIDEDEDEYEDDEKHDDDCDGDALHTALLALLVMLKRAMKARRSKLKWWMPRSRRSMKGKRNKKVNNCGRHKGSGRRRKSKLRKK